MAYRLDEKGDIVIDGWEKGISDDPFTGMANMRGVNLITTPGEASVNFATYKVSNGSMTGTITAVDTSTEIITATISTGSVVTYTAVTFSGSLPTGLVAGTVYWLVYNSSNSFTVYNNCYLNGSPVNLTTSTTGGTFASVNIAYPKAVEKDFGFIMDYNGRVWSPNTTIAPNEGSLLYTYMGNTVSSSNNGYGLQVLKNSAGTFYLLVFKDRAIDYTTIGDVRAGSFNTPSWVYGWNLSTGGSGSSNYLNTGSGQYERKPLLAQDNVIYFCNGSYVGSIREKSGSTFDPTSTSTYVYNFSALAIPLTDTVQCMAELGTDLLVGGARNLIYPWDRLSTSYRFPIFCAENSINDMVTVNNNTYVFAGFRGRIFTTNGNSISFFKKIPDHISNTSDPTITITQPTYSKNQIYFGVAYGTPSQGNSLSGNQYYGTWGIDIDTEALRGSYVQSTLNALPVKIFASNLLTAIAWYNYSDTTYGIDAVYSLPYISTGAGNDYYTLIETELLPVGLYLNKRTFSNIEYKLTRNPSSTEKVKISQRSSLSDSYVQIGETTSTTNLSDVYTVNFENQQWLQLKIELRSTSASPTFTRLKEVRIR